MDEVFNRLEQGRINIDSHPFFRFLQRPEDALEKKFNFAPVLIDFIMGFADMNKWFLTYDEAQTPYEASINEHAAEDATHSRLFYDNWYTLDLGGPEQWSAGKMLWWIFQANQTTAVRQFAMNILEIAVKEDDALIRFPLIEAIEICGDVFFGYTAPIAVKLQEQTGTRHDYFGQYHRARENGHLQADESDFARASLTAEQRQTALRVVDEVFHRFNQLLDGLVDYARAATTAPASLMVDIDHRFAQAISAPPTQPNTPELERINRASHRPAVDSALAKLLGRRIERLGRHPLMDWLQHEDTLDARDKLRRFVALYGIDIVAYRDFNELVLRYRSPSCDDERALNRWTLDLASHGNLYLRDWQALDMDNTLGWDAGETIAFYFLSAQTEWHRKYMADIKKLAFRHPQPALRWWLIRAIEAAGEPLFTRTRVLAQRAEQQHGLRLDYWAGRQHLAHADPSADNARPPLAAHRAPLPASAATVGRNMIESVFDHMEGLYSRTLEEAQTGTFVSSPGTLPPPRVSDIVLRARQYQPGDDIKSA